MEHPLAVTFTALENDELGIHVLELIQNVRVPRHGKLNGMVVRTEISPMGELIPSHHIVVIGNLSPWQQLFVGWQHVRICFAAHSLHHTGNIMVDPPLSHSLAPIEAVGCPFIVAVRETETLSLRQRDARSIVNTYLHYFDHLRKKEWSNRRLPWCETPFGAKHSAIRSWLFLRDLALLRHPQLDLAGAMRNAAP